MQLTWMLKSFEQLSNYELYAILRLRCEVFVVEQNCVYLDQDNLDPGSFHLMGRNAENELVAYCRLMPKGLAYTDYVSIGRVVNATSVRGHGIGQMLMREAITHCHALWGKQSIKIGAQKYLLKFYSGLGFDVCGEEYLEDGIPHLPMMWDEIRQA